VIQRLRQRLPVALQRRDYFLFWSAAVAESFGVNMVAVAIGWQVFSIRHSAFDLGLIGLLEFVPMLLLALPAGQLADRVSRHLVFAGAIGLTALVSLALIGVTESGAGQLWPFLVLAAVTGVANVLASASGRALGVTLVPWELLPSAIALRSLAFQGGTIVGPALGGLLFAIHPELVYAVATALFVLGTAAVLLIHEPKFERSGDAPGWSTFLAGVRFIRRTPVMLGAITLDLFAVLFGGAVALLPLFAKQILHTGPFGLGILRSATAVGALLAGIMLAHRPLRTHTGTTLLGVVAAFGVSMVVFGLSKTLWLSVVALAVSGFVDMISMNIRSTIAAVAAPDELRGRVNAVESVFISASNELGAFESGAAAALLGAVPAVVLGGVATIVLAGVWKWVFPDLANIDRIEELRPEPARVPEAAL
jgi:predicted MFS family arabinose efflux permease